jgi:hypothetical protein
MAVNVIRPMTTYLPGVPFGLFAFSVPVMLGSYEREFDGEKPEFGIYRQEGSFRICGHISISSIIKLNRYYLFC